MLFGSSTSRILPRQKRPCLNSLTNISWNTLSRFVKKIGASCIERTGGALRRPDLDFDKKAFGLKRYIATPKVSRHRLFVWFDERDLPDNLDDAVARNDDVSFGILESHYHEASALARGARIGVGNGPAYTPTLSFETFRS